MYDDEGNELFEYRTGVYHVDDLNQYISDAEKLLGTLLFDRRHFRKGFPEKSVGVRFEGLTEDEADALDSLELSIVHKALPEPIGLRW